MQRSMSVEYIDYREFGVVKIKYDTRACRIIFRVKDGVLEVTVPVSTPVKTITKCIDERRSDISEKLYFFSRIFGQFQVQFLQ